MKEIGKKLARKRAHTIAQMYKDYVENAGDAGLTPVESSVFRSIIQDYFNHLKDRLYRGMEVDLPARMGRLVISKKKTKSKTIDFGATRKEGYTIWHTNSHSGGYKYRLHWYNDYMVNDNVRKYGLQFVRQNKRYLAKLIKEQQPDFIEI